LPTEKQLRRALLLSLVAAKDRLAGSTLIVSSIDALGQADRDWLLAECLPKLIEQVVDVIVVFTGDIDTEWLPNGPNVALIRVGSPESSEVAKYFQSFADDPLGNVYIGASLDYGALKRLAGQHELALAEDVDSWR
jgi:hypothetical protein